LSKVITVSNPPVLTLTSAPTRPKSSPEKFFEILPASPVAIKNPSMDNIHERQSSSVQEERSAPIAQPESKHGLLEISSSFVSLEEQEIAPENEKQHEIELQSEPHEVYEADLPTWCLFVIVGG
jgi:hypothetical protein